MMPSNNKLVRLPLKDQDHTSTRYVPGASSGEPQFVTQNGKAASQPRDYSDRSFQRTSLFPGSTLLPSQGTLPSVPVGYSYNASEASSKFDTAATDRSVAHVVAQEASVPDAGSSQAVLNPGWARQQINDNNPRAEESTCPVGSVSTILARNPALRRVQNTTALTLTAGQQRKLLQRQQQVKARQQLQLPRTPTSPLALYQQSAYDDSPEHSSVDAVTGLSDDKILDKPHRSRRGSKVGVFLRRLRALTHPLDIYLSRSDHADKAPHGAEAFNKDSHQVRTKHRVLKMASARRWLRSRSKSDLTGHEVECQNHEHLSSMHSVDVTNTQPSLDSTLNIRTLLEKELESVPLKTTSRISVIHSNNVDRGASGFSQALSKPKLRSRASSSPATMGNSPKNCPKLLKYETKPGLHIRIVRAYTAEPDKKVGDTVIQYRELSSHQPRESRWTWRQQEARSGETTLRNGTAKVEVWGLDHHHVVSPASRDSAATALPTIHCQELTPERPNEPRCWTWQQPQVAHGMAPLRANSDIVNLLQQHDVQMHMPASYSDDGNDSCSENNDESNEAEEYHGIVGVTPLSPSPRDRSNSSSKSTQTGRKLLRQARNRLKPKSSFDILEEARFGVCSDSSTTGGTKKIVTPFPRNTFTPPAPSCGERWRPTTAPATCNAGH